MSTATGLTTNILTERPSWAIGTTLVVLTTGGVAVAALASARDGGRSRQIMSPASPSRDSGSKGHNTVAIGSRTVQAGRDVHTGIPAGYAVLSMLIVAVVAVVVLAVAVRLTSPEGVADVQGKSRVGGQPRSAPVTTRVVDRGIFVDCNISLYYFPSAVSTLKSSLPRSLDMHDAFDNSPTFAGWVAREGGWRAANWVRIAVQSKSTNAIILTRLSVNVVGRSPLTSRTKIADADGCGSTVVPRAFEINLGTHPPRLKAMPGKDEEGRPVKAVKFPFTVSATDPEIFDLSITAGPTADLQWTATLEFTQDGVGRQVVIDDGGRPFHSVPQDDLPEYVLMGGGNLLKM